MKTFKKIAGEAFYILRFNRIVAFPFFIMAAVDMLALYALYLAPQEPVARLLAPPIRAFWGERFLHYPSNLFLLPKLYHYAHIVLLATVGVLVTGAAMVIIQRILAKEKPSLVTSFIVSFKRYIGLLTIGITIFLLSFFLGKMSSQMSAFGFVLMYFFQVCIQIIFLYAMAAVVLDGENVIRALKRGLMLTKTNIGVTLSITAVAMILYVPVLVLKHNAVFLVNKFFPEIIIGIFCVGIIVMMLIDICVTLLVVLVYLKTPKK